jgi:hypothetical protein
MSPKGTEGEMMSKKSVGTFTARVFMLALAVFLMLPAAAFAQRGNQRREDRQDRRDDRQDRREERRGRNWDRYGQYGGSFQLRQTALNAGYNEGIKEGRRDRNRRRNSDYRNNSVYRNATKDYSSRLGDKELYRRYYRDGYENGYNDGYNGY